MKKHLREQVAKDLQEILAQVSASMSDTPSAYAQLFKEKYARYKSKKIQINKIKSRYAKELALIVFSMKILQAQNPKFNKKIQYLDKYYNLPNVDININYNLSLEEINEVYLLSTRILLVKNEKYFCEFYTPTTIAKTLIDSIDLKKFPDDGTILDPCCGPGNLLSMVLIRLSNEKCSISAFNEFMSKHLYGYDILPFSAILSILQLYTVHQYYTNNSQPPDVNITIKDSLDDLSDKKFTYIIANPPYQRTTNDYQLARGHKDILTGHTNLYLLFLLWSLDKVEKNGRVIFLIPQTLRVGLYNHNFRKLFAQKYALNRIVLFDEKTNIFPGVEQKVMILDISKKSSPKDTIVDFYSEHGEKRTSRFLLPYEQILIKTNSTCIWQLTSNDVNYSIIRKVKSKSVPIDNLDGMFIVGTGAYVWNQHKNSLRRKYNRKLLPLVYANSIKNPALSFPTKDIRKRKEFTLKLGNVKYMDKPALLIKRTTTTEINKKIQSTLVSSQFLNKYPRYYLENHVNFIRSEDSKLQRRYLALMYYFNSPLLNYYFNSIASTSQISVYEIRALPVNMELLDQIQPLAEEYAKSRNKHVLTEMYRQIYRFFNLNTNEVGVIEEFFCVD